MRAARAQPAQMVKIMRTKPKGLVARKIMKMKIDW